MTQARAIAVFAFSLATACALSWRAAPAIAQTGCSSPGCYGPIQEEPGVHERGLYAEVSHQTRVNHFGGNLIISATDIEVPSLGGFVLGFSRTYNSARTYTPLPSNDANNSPLGIGWTCHYGVLWPPGSMGSVNPELIHNDGRREIFYPHNRLTADIIIPAVGMLPRFISASLSVLRQKDADTYELFQATGLKLTLSRLNQYAYFVTTKIEDYHGNAWTVAYTNDSAPYFEHPLVNWVIDDFGRMLIFVYQTLPNNNGKKRLKEIRFDGSMGKILSKYEYDSVPNSSEAFLTRHKTGEDRTTVYANNLGTIPDGRGTISAITLPTGGVTAIGYQLRSFQYQAAQPSQVFAVVSLNRDGKLWTYDYVEWI